MKLYKSQNMPASAFTLLMLSIVWMQSLTLVECQNEELKAYYEHLHKTYSEGKDTIKSDCNIADTPGGKIDSMDHSDWGTLSTLEFLSEKRKDLTHGEKLQNFDKLRVFLARVGYLKVPGSLVFVNKQAETLRLFGCGDDAVWKMQGEKGVDPGFRDTGGELKTHAPNSADYVHKFTCFQPKGKDSCSHTFYVITRMLPELPSGFQVRENDVMESDDWRFTCAVPVCNVKQCEVTGEKLNRRAYPPYTITWSVESRAESEEATRGKEQSNLKLSKKESKANVDKQKIEVMTGEQIRKDQEEDGAFKESYTDATDAQWINAFGDKVNKTAENPANSNKNDTSGDEIEYIFNSRLILLGADFDLHNGPFECIIQDGNGVVSTPSVIKEGYRDWVDYRGKANIHVMRSWTSYLFFAVGIAAIVLVAIIILACPKKMEYDDGTPYTKEELMAPSAAAAAQQQRNSTSKGNKKNERKNSKPKNE